MTYNAIWAWQVFVVDGMPLSCAAKRGSVASIGRNCPPSFFDYLFSFPSANVLSDESIALARKQGYLRFL